MREDAHATTYYSDDDGLINAMPNMQQTLLQFTALAYIKSSSIYKEYLT